jgi:malto-oligosyltrehalose synthase/4-alpha-glucanotransferase
MYNPGSTYRLQFSKDFTFADAKQLIEYFHLLGTGTIYASPVFGANPGSSHGYDITNPHIINPELGTEEELQKLSKSLKNRRIGWLQDIVPNHMSFSCYNKWIMDVLEKGRDSEFAGIFDIDRQHPHFRNKLMLPFLEDHPKKVLEQGNLRIAFENGTFFIKYFDYFWPLRFESFLWILDQTHQVIPNSLSLLIDTHQLEEKPPDYLFLNGEWERFKEKFFHLCNGNRDVHSFCENLASEISGNPDAMKALLDNQHYTLSYWKDASLHINYRRFFIINNLICLRMEDEEVFNLYHRELRRWLNCQMFDGLIIDHIDDLYDPANYLKRLRKLTGSKQYIVAEKILGPKESLPENWPIQGTAGHGFLAQVNNLFTREKGITKLQTLYLKITNSQEPFYDLIYQSKKLILSKQMQGEWHNLTDLFLKLRLLEGENAGKFHKSKIHHAIGEILLAMPVHRLYAESLPLTDPAFDVIKKTLTKALQRNKDLEEILSVFEELFLATIRTRGDRNQRILHFFNRLMQLSVPLMAKGLENTAMYQPSCFPKYDEAVDFQWPENVTAETFHEAMLQRKKQCPFSLNTTSSPDTKKGEDARVRLTTINEFPEKWEDAVCKWMDINRPLKNTIDGRPAPSSTEEYFIYQTLISIAPFDGEFDKTFLEKICNYINKTLRKAKENTSWDTPDFTWENAVKEFIFDLFKPDHTFKEAFLDLQQKIAHYGIFNSLSQLTLKCTCPGIPDLYNGTELWDLHLTDQDNKHPVDFKANFRALKKLKEQYSLHPVKLFSGMLKSPENENIKLWLTHRLLRSRKENPALFSFGDYIPLSIKGNFKNNVMAFARHYKDVWHITIIPLFLSSFEEHGNLVSPQDIDWKSTKVILPDKAPSDWINVFTGRPYSTGQELSVHEIFETSPVGILHADTGRKARAAGVLMHITSLPGRFASGDFGPNAYRFIDFLKESGHSYWQVLPFTQTTNGAGWSPYSSPSAFAGNILMISPHKLTEESLIDKDAFKKHQTVLSEKADFLKALYIREELTRVAYENFISHDNPPAKQEFKNFCNKENFWLDDYALFILFKRQFEQKSWNLWPEQIRNRDSEMLKKAKTENEYGIELEKFRQYLFARQWQGLKKYANHHGIRIIGDIPIYVSYDNADVWANPRLFKLNEDKSMKAVAGVPPDYFSETGQLWNMPVYNWEMMAKENFRWWIQRIRKNLELFDVVRLDHFRGFEAYWEVPARDTTAKNGLWVKGPGKELFLCLKEAFPSMPFIAEDLGDVNEEVYSLRDEFGIPGMKVLQFAFGDDLPESTHIPHNFSSNSIVYTGTHDNNTAQGWYRFELDKTSKKRLKLYTGNKVKAKNIHHTLTRLAWASQAKLVIVPAQDLIGKDAEAQMNRPSIPKGNWTWRLKSMNALNEIAGHTRELLEIFSR